MSLDNDNPKYRRAIVTDNHSNPITEVRLERAITWEQQQSGLMNRTELGENEGMVFILDWEDYFEVWMKDTLLTLDIIFLDRFAQINTIHHSTIPNRDDIRYAPLFPSKFVIELNGGFCLKFGIKEGYYIIPINEE